jgi:HEAT repeat protein
MTDKELNNLKKYLTDTDRAISLYAVKALRKFPADTAAAILIDFVENNFGEEVRPHKTESLKILKETGNSEIKQKLINLLSKEEDPYVLSSLINCCGSVFIPGEYISSKILPFLSHDDPRVVANAIEVIAKQDPDLVKYSLKSFLFSKIPRQAMNAAIAFYNAGEEKIFAYIAAKAECTEIFWHPSAIYALGKIKNPESGKKLLSMLPAADEITKICLLKAIELTADNNLISPLISCLLVEKNPEIQKHFINTLKNINEEITLSKLTEIWESTGNSRIQATVIKSLGYYEIHGSGEIFNRGLNSSDPRVKANTIEAIMNRKMETAAPVLMELVNSNESRIQCNALLALWKMGYTYVIKNLKEIINTSDSAKKSSIQWLVEQMNLSYMFNTVSAKG